MPSWTETLFELGVGARVVGVTDWCVHPAAGVAAVPRVGGTKNPRLDAITALAPDLVVANREENRKKDVEALLTRGIRVWVSDARSVAAAVREIGELAALVGVSERAAPLIAACIKEIDRSPTAALRAFVPIWKDPWMTMNRDTYMHDMLRLSGADNIFADRRDRYPRVSLDDVIALKPALILLPDEPYRFSESDAAAFANALPYARVELVDGTLLSWYGPRIPRALEIVRAIVARNN